MEQTKKSVLETYLPALASTIPVEIHDCFTVPMCDFWDESSPHHNQCVEIHATPDKDKMKDIHFKLHKHLHTGFIYVPTPIGDWYVVYALLAA